MSEKNGIKTRGVRDDGTFGPICAGCGMGLYEESETCSWCGEHQCCGCSCDGCEYGHSEYGQHSNACQDRFWLKIDTNTQVTGIDAFDR